MYEAKTRTQAESTRGLCVVRGLCRGGAEDERIEGPPRAHPPVRAARARVRVGVG